MALTTINCSPDCDEETGLLLKFDITSLVLNDVDKDLGFKNILVNLTFDGNVIKMDKSTEDPEFREKKVLSIRSTTSNFCTKLKECPILINLSRGCKDLGTRKLKITECFAEAVKCNDFHSQKVTSELEFEVEEKKNALMTICVTVKISPDDGLNDLFQQYGAVRKMATKKRKIALKKQMRDAGQEEDFEEEEESADDCEDTNEPCDDFECPDQISDACKVNMVLKEKIYKIFNGNLINIKDKVGPCGIVKCPTANKIAIDLCKSKSIRSIPLNNPYDVEPKCEQMLGQFPCGCHVENKVICSTCGGFSLGCNKPAQPVETPVVEESTLKKLCKQYGIDLDEIQSPNGSVPPKSKKMKRRKKCSKAIAGKVSEVKDQLNG